jgi:hypothetical protein
VVVVYVQRLSLGRRLELQVLCFSPRLFLNATAYHLVILQPQCSCVPHENIVEVSFAGPGRLFSTVPKRAQDFLQDLFSPVAQVMLLYSKDFAYAESMHIFGLHDVLDEQG